MSRPLLMGEAPSRSGDRYWAFPLSGLVGQRLCTWSGLEPDARGTRYGRYYWPLREAFDLENLLERYPGPKGAGADFPTGPGREAADARVLDDWAGRSVVLLGRRLMRAFRLPTDTAFHEWVGVAGARVAAIPHPSGLTRNYNDESEREMAGRTLRLALDPDRMMA